MVENGDETEKKAVTIKKYANRHLYNTESSNYATLDQLCDMVKEGRDFVVYDAKTGDDITRAVLTQIILEQEGKGEGRGVERNGYADRTEADTGNHRSRRRLEGAVARFVCHVPLSRTC